jgi:hypothetical protein
LKTVTTKPSSSGGFELLGQFGRHLPDAAAERAHQLLIPRKTSETLFQAPVMIS